MGFDLGDNLIPIADLAGYRVRSGDIDRLAPFDGKNDSSDLHIAINKRDSAGAVLSGSYENGGVDDVSAEVRGTGCLGVAGGCARCCEHWSSTNGGLGVGEGWMDGEGGEAFIAGVYFPLLSVLMPRWLEQVHRRSKAGRWARMMCVVPGVMF